MSKESHYLYALTFDASPRPVVFYVGHTNNPKRRETEHRASAKDLSNTEYKYQWCRQLEAVDVAWDFVVIGEIEDDEDAEYEWVLKFARDNHSKGITFIDDLPLTNMKAGDFLAEILDRTDIRTKQDIKKYRTERAARQVNYLRDEQSEDFVATERGDQFREYIQTLGEAAQAKTLEEREQAEQRAKRQVKTLNSQVRKLSLEDQTIAMIGAEIDRGTRASKAEIQDWLKLIGSHVRTMETMYDPAKPGAASPEEHKRNIEIGYQRLAELKEMLDNHSV
jgi:hypothetical protein